MSILRKYFIAGLLVWLPIWVTLLVLHFLINMLNSTFALLPHPYQPQQLLGIILSLIVVLLTGMLVTNFLGKRLIEFGEYIVNRIPLVRSIYTAAKQVIESLLSSNGQSFRKVVFVEYPRAGCWSLAFVTGTFQNGLCPSTHEELVTVFIPTTPNPTSGFLLALPKSELHEADLTIEQALKLVISLGVVQPTKKTENTGFIK